MPRKTAPCVQWPQVVVMQRRGLVSRLRGAALIARRPDDVDRGTHRLRRRGLTIDHLSASPSVVSTFQLILLRCYAASVEPPRVTSGSSLRRFPTRMHHSGLRMRVMQLRCSVQRGRGHIPVKPFSDTARNAHASEDDPSRGQWFSSIVRLRRCRVCIWK